MSEEHLKASSRGAQPPTEDQQPVQEHSDQDCDKDEPTTISTADKIRQKRLEQLAQAREKAVAKRKMLGDIRRKEKELQEKVVKERIQQIQQLEANIQAPETKKKTKPRKIVKKVIEVSDSSSGSDIDDTTDEEPEVQYIVKRKPKTVKQTKAKTVKPVEEEARSYNTNELTAEVAKNLLKKKVIDDAQLLAMKSLFPFHQF